MNPRAAQIETAGLWEKSARQTNAHGPRPTLLHPRAPRCEPALSPEQDSRDTSAPRCGRDRHAREKYRAVPFAADWRSGTCHCRRRARHPPPAASGRPFGADWWESSRRLRAGLASWGAMLRKGTIIRSEDAAGAPHLNLARAVSNDNVFEPVWKFGE